MVLNLIPLLLGVAVAPTKPTLLRTFTAVQSGYSVATGALNASISGPVAVDEALAAQFQREYIPDGRFTSVVFRYGNGTSSGDDGVFSLQPFFDERVCYVYPLPPGYPGHSITYDLALEELWCQQGAPCMDAYKQAVYSGPSSVSGEPCDLWVSGAPAPGASSQDTLGFCVRAADGALLSLTRDYHGGGIDVVVRTFFANLSAVVDPAAFATPNVSGCVDLRVPAATSSAAALDRPVNDAAAIAQTNADAAGAWSAAPSAPFGAGLSLRAAAARRLGLKMAASGPDARGFALAPPPAAHSAALLAAFPEIPAAFDAREQWGAQCTSIGSVRNQGDCGGCWAFSAAEVLADRTCIAAQAAAAAAAAINWTSFALSPQYIMDCDDTDAACGGGMLDDAWRYLARPASGGSGGTVEEACAPYLYCAHPVSPSCEVGPHPPRPTPSQQACPASFNCSAPRRFRAASAYAAAAPGDVAALQRELLAHGPVQVGFQVFSDFMTYKNGTYFRTAGAQGPLGGHAVKLVGWGTDGAGVPYWSVANSWSADWGEGGFFRIRRGTNEVGIETTPAAGLADLAAARLLP